MVKSAHDVLQSVAENGAEIVRRFIPVNLNIILQSEVEHLKFKPSEEPQCKLVRQKFERIGYRTIPRSMAALEELEGNIRKYVTSAAVSFPNLADWIPNDIAIQKYDQEGYITAHRDLKRHILVIAIANIDGSCRLETLTSRKRATVRQFLTEPGDLILMRAPGLTDATEDRPFHRITGNLYQFGHRISVTFRLNNRPYEPVPGHSYEN